MQLVWSGSGAVFGLTTISPSWMFASGVALMTVILLRRLWRRNRRKPKSDPAWRLQAGPRVEQPLLDAPPELLRWQVEMHDVARELKGEIDSKIRVFDQLIAQAREERVRLEAILREAKRAG